MEGFEEFFEKELLETKSIWLHSVVAFYLVVFPAWKCVVVGILWALLAHLFLALQPF